MSVVAPALSSRSRTNKFVRATNSLFASIRSKLISPVARTSFTCPWCIGIYSARCGGTDKLCLSVVVPALSFSLTDKQVCPCHQLTLRQYPEQAHLSGGTDKLCLSVVVPALSFSLTDKQVCPCHQLTRRQYPEQAHLSRRWHGQALLVRGGAGSILLAHGQTSLSVPPTHSSPVSGTSSFLRWHGQALLVRGSAGSILLAHGQTSLSVPPIFPCHQFFRATILYFVCATSFKNERHMRLPMPTTPTMRKAHWSPRACPTNPMVRGPVISPSSL